MLVVPVTSLFLKMGDNTTLYYAASICAAASLALVLKWRGGGTRPPYPPGPKRYPLIGSVLELPSDVPMWEGFTSIAEKFSRYPTPAGGHQTKDVPFQDTDVLYLKLFSQDLVVLNSTEAIYELTEKRSNIYSDRVRRPIKYFALSH